MERHKTNIVTEFHEEYFRTRFQYDKRREPVWRAVTRYIQAKYIPPNSRILDVGAGYCDFINNAVGVERHAVDIWSRVGDFAAEGVSAHVGNCGRMAFLADRSVDVVFASNIFEHLTHEELLTTLAEIRRVLSHGGRLIVLQPNFKYCYRTYFDDYTHLQIFTHAGMYDLLEMAGLRILDVAPRFLPVNMKQTLKLRLPFLGAIVAAYLRLPFRPMAGQMLLVAENVWSSPATASAGSRESSGPA